MPDSTPETKPPIELTEPIWQHQMGESARWYDRFHRYMLAGSKRSLIGVVRLEKAEKGGKGRVLKVPGAWNRSFARFRWRERAAGWDEYQRQINQEVWEANFKELRESAWEMSKQHLARHEQMMKVPLFEQTMIRDDNGHPVSVTIMPSRWTYKDILATSAAVVTLGGFAIGDVQAAEQLLDTLGYKVLLEENGSERIDQFVSEET